MFLGLKVAGLCSLLYFIPLMGHAQVFPDLEFSQLSEKNGLSGNYVNSITQDKEGFIWISTSDGLNRYDGYQVKKFFHRPNDSSSLLNNSIGDLVPDEKNNLWIVTSDGLSYFEKRQNRFINFKKNKKEGPGTPYDHFRSVYVDPASNEAWTSGYRSFYCIKDNLSLSRQALAMTARNPLLPGRLPQNATLYKDRTGQLWAYDSTCIFRIGPAKKNILSAGSPGKWSIASFYQDHAGNYWTGTIWGGILRFDPVARSFHRLDIRIAGNAIYSITEWKDKGGKDWIVLGTNRGITL